MKTIGTFEAKTHLSRLLAEVEFQHEEFFIQKHGRSVAVLLPFETYQGQLLGARKKDVIAGLKEVRSQAHGKVSSKEIRAWIHEGRKR